MYKSEVLSFQNVYKLTYSEFFSYLLKNLEITYNSDNCLHCGKLAVQTKSQQHNKEKKTPKWRAGHLKYGFSEHHKRQTRSSGQLQQKGIYLTPIV